MNDLSFAIIFLFIFNVACGPSRQKETGEAEMEVDDSPMVYSAELSSLNQNLTDEPVTGSLTITVQGDSATIDLDVSSLAPDMMHLAHLHGHEDGSEAACPAAPEADKNGDDIVDLIETRDYSGITMIPFHDDPVSLEIKTESYPRSDAQGNLEYSEVISVQELSSAVRNKFGIKDLEFNDFVVFVHGVSEQSSLPESVQSLPDVPAMVTLPVACGELD